MKKKRNNALIFALWALIAVIIFNMLIFLRGKDEASVSGEDSYNLKATYLVRAGIMKMLMELAKDVNTYDSLNEDWNRGPDNPKKLILKDDTVFYGASDESGRLNLNSAALEKRNLLRLGVDDYIADNILGYIEKKGAEGFEFIEELFLVEGMTREDFSEIEDLVTIYRGDDPRVNINTAGRKVLEALIESKETVGEVLDYRKGPDGEEGTDDDGFKDTGGINVIGGLSPDLFTVRSHVFRIWAEFPLPEDRGAVKGAEAVIDKKSGKIYHWKEY